MPKKPKPIPRGKNQGKALSPSDREAIRQMYAVYGNKREVARKMGVCEMTVHNVLGSISDPTYDKVRAETALETAGRVQAVVHRVIDSIDDEKLKRASLPQAGIFMGIGIDKIQRLQEHAKNLREQGSSIGLLPQNLKDLVPGIVNKVNQLTILGIKIEQQAPDLADRMETAMQVAEAQDAEEEKPAEPLDFYNASSNSSD